MSNEITICLGELEKHLPLDACPKRIGLPEFTMIQEDDCRPLLDEAEYQTLFEAARKQLSSPRIVNREAKTGSQKVS